MNKSKLREDLESIELWTHVDEDGEPAFLGHDEINKIMEILRKNSYDPFDFVEPCEPDCSEVRHAYHQGQWDLATRLSKGVSNG